jgi:hypothetical protein
MDHRSIHAAYMADYKDIIMSNEAQNVLLVIFEI